jgi:hypothetical protein
MKNEKLRQSIFSKRTFAKGCISPWPIFVMCCILILPVLFIACEYNNKPGMIYDPTVVIDTTGRPTITGITPATEAVAGVREITIVGTNLGIKNGTDTNWVFIGGARPVIKDIQNSSITIYRPALSNDHYGTPLYVNVTDLKMLTVSSSFTYMVESPGAVVGDYSPITTSVLAVEFDKQENLYATAARNVYQTDFAGVTQILVLNAINLLSSEYASITAMSFGPGAHNKNLFIADSKNYIARLYVANTFPDSLARTNLPVKLTVPAAVSQLDFDGNGNLYVGGNGNIYVADSSVGTSAAPAFTLMTGYTGGPNIKKIRVVKESGNQYLYVADSLGVWRSQIVGSSLVNCTQLVNLNGTALSACLITSFELDEHSSIFLCLRNNVNYSLFIRENDGSIAPFYSDPNILPNTVDKLTWGNSKYLYLISSSLTGAGKIYRLTLDRNGAPYQGRTFIK